MRLPTSFNLWCAAFSSMAAALFIVDGNIGGAMLNLGAGVFNYGIYRWTRYIRRESC